MTDPYPAQPPQPQPGPGSGPDFGHPGHPMPPGPSFVAPGQALPPAYGPPPQQYAYGHPLFDPQAGQPAPDPYQPPVAPQPQPHPWGFGPAENVGRGVVFAIGAIPVAAAAAGLLTLVGFYASIASFVLAALAVNLYTKGSGGKLSKGVPAVIGVIVAGVVICYFTSNAVDLAKVYNRDGGERGYGSMLDFVALNFLDPTALTGWQRDILLFLLFAVLGTYSTIRRLLTSRRAAR